MNREIDWEEKAVFDRYAGPFHCFVNASFLWRCEDPSYEQTGKALGVDFRSHYSQKREEIRAALKKITPEDVEEMLRCPYWRINMCGASFAALKGWREFEQLIGRNLVACENVGSPQYYCFALARFGTHYGAHCIRGHLNKLMRDSRKYGYFCGDWLGAIGALNHLDSRLRTRHAEDYSGLLAVCYADIERQKAGEATPVFPLDFSEPIEGFERTMRLAEELFPMPPQSDLISR